jgi:hypothetical protein
MEKLKKTISIIVLLIFFLVQTISAQEKKDSTNTAGKLKNKFMVGIGAAPIYTFPTYDSRTKKGDITMGYSLYIKYKITKRLNLSTGLSYESLKYETRANYNVSGFPIKLIYEYKLESVPLKLDIAFGRKKLFAHITPGIYLSKLISYQYKTISSYGNSSIPLVQKGKNLTLGSIAASIHYTLNKHVDLFVEPEKVIAFTPLQKNGLGEGINYLQYAKINIGFFYVF